MDSEQAILALAALAQSTRLDVFRLLTKHEPEGLAAGEVAKALAVPQNTMSSHLAILRKDGRGNFRAFSAGSQPKGTVNPFAIKVLNRLDYPTDDLRSKSWEEFARGDAPVMDFVFTVCDNAAGESCPVWPGQPMTAHWGIED